ncbi:MAG: glycosyltransferase family 2 protein, partial [Reichenbachiella sp.]
MPELDISVVIPLLNEEESLPELCQWIERVMIENKFSYEILLIDDGSTDSSWQVINELKKKNEAIKGIKFNRNYGKSAALNIGFKDVIGDVIITMDADLQDSPDEIPGLYKMIKDEGLDLVSGWKKKRYDPIMKTIPSKLFNSVARVFSGVKLNDFNCGLKAYHHQVVKDIDIYGEMHRYIPFLAKGQGYDKIGEKVVQHQARKYGTTKFGIERFIFGFLDLLSISFVSKFKKRPMHFFGTLGTLSFFMGTAITVWVITRKIYEIQMGLPAREIVDQPLFF